MYSLPAQIRKTPPIYGRQRLAIDGRNSGNRLVPNQTDNPHFLRIWAAMLLSCWLPVQHTHHRSCEPTYAVSYHYRKDTQAHKALSNTLACLKWVVLEVLTLGTSWSALLRRLLRLGRRLTWHGLAWLGVSRPWRRISACNSSLVAIIGCNLESRGAVERIYLLHRHHQHPQSPTASISSLSLYGFDKTVSEGTPYMTPLACHRYSFGRQAARPCQSLIPVRGSFNRPQAGPDLFASGSSCIERMPCSLDLCRISWQWKSYTVFVTCSWISVTCDKIPLYHVTKEVLLMHGTQGLVYIAAHVVWVKPHPHGSTLASASDSSGQHVVFRLELDWV